MKAGLAIIDKRRDSPNKAKFMNLIGEVQGLAGDHPRRHGGHGGDPGGSGICAGLRRAPKVCMPAASIRCSPVPAVQRINDSIIQELTVTNTIPLKAEAVGNRKFKVLSVASLLAEAIKRIHCNDSVSSLFV